MEFVLFLILFTAAFAASGIVTYRFCRKKAEIKQHPDSSPGDGEDSGR